MGCGRSGKRPDGQSKTASKTSRAPAPDRPELLYNLGNVLLNISDENAAEAAPLLRRAVELRPQLTSAWLHLGRAHEILGQPAEAEESYRNALSAQPDHTASYLALSRLLLSRQRTEEALRWLRHGSRVARQTEELKQLLAETESAAAR